MLYLGAMRTLDEAEHNFTIWKLVNVLYGLDCISTPVVEEHINAMEQSRSLGTELDLNTYRISARPWDDSYHQF